MLFEILARHNCAPGKHSEGGRVNAAGADLSLDDVRLHHPEGPAPVLAFLASDPNELDYDAWAEMMHAVKAALGPTREDHYEAVAAWCDKCPSATPEQSQKTWDSITTSRIGYRFIPYPPEVEFQDVPEDVAAAIDAVPDPREQAKAKVKRPAILRLAALCEASEARDFVEDLLCDEQISVWNGEPNAGKTFTAIDLALRVSLGWRYHGRDVERGGAIYVAGEGASGIKQRVAAFREHHGVEETAGAWFAVVPSAVDFRDKASVAGLISVLTEEAPRLGGKVRLIVVDTLSRALAGGDENSSVDMGMVVAAADRIRLATGAHVMFIHHTGKDASKGARGHSLLRGNVDTEVMVERGETPGTVIARVTKQRDLECAGVLSLRLRQVKLGTNRRGKPITSCVAETAEMPRPKLPEKISWCLLCLNKMLPEDVSECSPSETNGVELEAWRDECLSRLGEGRETKRDTLRTEFNRAKEHLLKHGYITISGSKVEIPL
jgi:AAA domain/Primase C terminal 2 (PriCT-2)